jgi:holo-[acyl-carrier protein] synthase
MKILGTGVDIVDKSRIKASIKNKLFIKRIFSFSEISNAKKFKDKLSYYSNRFAAKEALSKSIGTGFRNNLNFKDITIVNNKLGKPSFIVNKKIMNIVKKKFNVTSINFFLSMSDEKKYSIAYVILQKNED